MTPRENPELERLRRHYAEEVVMAAGIDSPALREAFARVPRERFLGDGPWHIPVPEGVRRDGDGDYRTTPDADPARICHNVLVAIDRERGLNNGHPSALAHWIFALDVRAGDRVVHVGAGVGYYTAIIAELCGPGGSVTAIELDPALAARATRNLASWPQVEVRVGDGSAIPGRCNAIFVNAGCTHPRAEWLDAIDQEGRLLLPLTAANSSPTGAMGVMMKVRRSKEELEVSFVSMVAIFHCEGARDSGEEPAILGFLQASMPQKRTPCVLLRGAHDPGPTCLLHTGRYCISARSPIAASPAP